MLSYLPGALIIFPTVFKDILRECVKKNPSKNTSPEKNDTKFK